MTLDEILEMWEADSQVLETKLAESSLDTAKLHAKYLKLLVNFKRRKTELEEAYDVLRRYKFRYFRGELSRKELEELGWEQWQHPKPIKNEMEELVRGDKELRSYVTKIETLETAVDAVDSIMKHLKDRGYAIGNAIKWKIHLNGG